MKLLNKILMVACLFSGITSCEMREEILGKGEAKEYGLLSLDVEAVAPKSMTKVAGAIATDNFQVSVVGVNPELNGFVKDFKTVTDVPKPLELSVGTYNVVSHSPGELKKQMDLPYFGGKKELIIEKGKNNAAAVLCKMLNSRIQLEYTPEFLSKFQRWTITVDDGTGTAYAVSHDNSVGTSPKPGYYYFGENGAKYIMLNIRATTVDGNTIVFSQPYYKKDAENGYDEVLDNPNFHGGDALIITLKPKTENTPDLGIVGLGVTVNVIFHDKETPVEIEVTDKNPAPDPTPDPEPLPGPQTGAQDPSLDLPKGGTFTAATFPAKYDAILKAPAGLQSMVVSIETTDKAEGGFESILKGMTFGKEGVGSLLTGSDLVGNVDMQTLFDAFSPGTNTPNIGDTEYVFPISAFNLLTGFPGTHTFHIVLTDKNGKVAKGSIVLTITQ